jgi:hemerythrin superfamily protein
MREAVLEAGKASQRDIDQQKIAADITLLKKYGFEEKEIDSILSLKEGIAPLEKEIGSKLARKIFDLKMGITPLMDQFHLLDSKLSLTRNEKDELELTFPRKLRELKLLIFDHDLDPALAQKLIEMKGDFPLLLKRLTALNENEKEQIGNLVKEIKIKFLLTRIPEIVKQVKEMTDATRQEIIQEHFIKEVSAKPNSRGNLFSFVGDFERSEAFERKDEKLNIDDKAPQPPYLKNRESKGLTKEQLLIQQTEMDEERAARPIIGAALLDELLKYEEGSLIWKPILQTAVGQFNHYRVHGDFKKKFMFDSIENNKILDFQVNYTGDKNPPIKMEIIRDPDSKKIQRVNIVVEGSFDLVDNEKIEVSEAVFGSLKYSITLDSEKRPVISDVVSKLEFSDKLKT